MKSDEVLLKHILDAAQEISNFIQNKNQTDFEKDRLLHLSVIRLLEVIGEAASGISSEFRKKNVSFPWKEMVGTRNRLIHGYFDIDLRIIWQTITTDIPVLIKKLKPIIEKI